MTEREKMLAGELYRSNDPELVALRVACRRLTHEINTLPPWDPAFDGLIRRLLGSIGEGFVIEPPLRCDYGCNTFIGRRFYANFNLTILDCGRVTIGDEVLIGPNVSLFAAGHPLDPDLRASGPEYGLPIVIKDRVWLGGGVIVNPGVTIGEGSVIGSGSVVTRDIPPGVLAAGNPCRVLRPLRQGDRP